jgi:hypothetical protein
LQPMTSSAGPQLRILLSTAFMSIDIPICHPRYHPSGWSTNTIGWAEMPLSASLSE